MRESADEAHVITCVAREKLRRNLGFMAANTPIYNVGQLAAPEGGPSSQDLRAMAEHACLRGDSFGSKQAAVRQQWGLGHKEEEELEEGELSRDPFEVGYYD